MVASTSARAAKPAMSMVLKRRLAVTVPTTASSDITFETAADGSSDPAADRTWLAKVMGSTPGCARTTNDIVRDT